MVGKNDYLKGIVMGKKTRFALILSGILALSVSTGTTLANTGHTDAAKKLTDLQKEIPIEQGILKSSVIQQLETQLHKGLSIQNYPFSEVNASAVNKAASDYLWEQEPNDSFNFADQLSYSKATVGQLMPYYDMDFYKVKVPSNGILAVGGGTTSYEIDLLFAAAEKEFGETGKLEYLGSDYDDELEIQFYQAKAGTYYVPVLDADDYSNSPSDLYIIATSFLDNVAPSKPTVNAFDDNDTAISGKAEANSTITVKNGSKVIATTKTAASGTFSAKIAVQKAGVKLVVTAEDSAKNKSAAVTVTVKVADKTAPAKPTINKVDNNDAVISGKAEASSTVTVKNNSKVIATTKATASGTFSVKIPVQKAGAILTVNAKDQSGNISSTASVTVVDVVAPALPTINKVTIKDLKVTGKAEVSSTVTIKAGNTVLGSAKADAKGTYSVKIKAQKAGVTIEATAKDKAGNVSKKATKVVAKK